MPKLSVGVIGAGSIGNVHLTGYAANKKSVDIKAICDITKSRLNEMGEKFNVPAESRYTDYKKMLASEELDAVSICTPNYLHFEIAMAAVKAGLNILLEKPMVLNLKEAKALKKALDARGNDVKFMVAFSHRFITPNIAAKKALDKGLIGDPFMIRVRYAHSGPFPGWAQSDWFYSPAKAGGGAMLDMGIHAIDICQYFIGEIASVQAEVKTLRKKIKVDDNAVMLLDFGPKKALGYIEVGWTTTAGFAGIEIYGDKGCIRLELGKPGVIVRGVTKPDGTIDMKEEEIPFPKGNWGHWPLQMDSFVNYLLDKKTVTAIPGYAEGISSLGVALAASESTKTGKRVKVKR